MSSKTLFYHFTIRYKAGADFAYAYEVNRTEKQVIAILAEIMESKPEILFDGRTIFPKRINVSRIFLTEKKFPHTSQ